MEEKLKKPEAPRWRRRGHEKGGAQSLLCCGGREREPGETSSAGVARVRPCSSAAAVLRVPQLHLPPAIVGDPTSASTLGQRGAHAPLGSHLASPFMHASEGTCLHTQTERASTRIAALLKASDGTPLGVRMGMTNDWGSATGFTYTLNFVRDGELQASDERIELPDSAVLFIERKALWVGEGGLLGSTVDIDEKLNIIVTPKVKDEPV